MGELDTNVKFFLAVTAVYFFFSFFVFDKKLRFYIDIENKTLNDSGNKMLPYA